MQRRRFLKGGALSAVGALGLFRPEDGHTQDSGAVPNSSGTARPRLRVPANSCDCHHHVYDAVRFPPPEIGPRFVMNARLEEYRLLQRRLGTTRSIIVTPSAYGGRNDATIDAVARSGTNARGVVVVSPEVSDAELKAMAGQGIRGIRFSLASPARATLTVEMIEPLAKRIAPLGWHVQLYMRGDQILAATNLLNRLPVPLVLDHMGLLREPEGRDRAAFAAVRRLLEKGRTWIKLSGAYIRPVAGSDVGYTMDFEPADRVARALVKAAPERMLWGSDWPHPGMGPTEKPDDAALLNLLSVWAPTEATRNRILSDNPAALYGFGG